MFLKRNILFVYRTYYCIADYCCKQIFTIYYYYYYYHYYYYYIDIKRYTKKKKRAFLFSFYFLSIIRFSDANVVVIVFFLVLHKTAAIYSENARALYIIVDIVYRQVPPKYGNLHDYYVGD